VAAAAPPSQLFAQLAQPPSSGGRGTDRPGGPAADPSAPPRGPPPPKQALPRATNAPDLARRPLPGHETLRADVAVFGAALGAGPRGGVVGVDAGQATLVRTGELASVQELGFAFKRASSRLVEMSGRPYHAQHAVRWPNAVPLPEE
jgi:predicted ATPase